MQMNRTGIIRSILLLAVAGVALFQLVWVGKSSARLGVNKVWVDRHMDAISRSADAAYGGDFNGYITFLRQQIPQEATVVDTRTFGLTQYDSDSFIQYFLFPRTMVPVTDTTCQGESDLNLCLIHLSGPHTYFMVGANFKISPMISGRFHILMFNSTLGLLAPLTTQGQP